MAILDLSFELNITGAGSSNLVAADLPDIGVRGYGADDDAAGEAGTAAVLRFLADRIEAGDYAIGADGFEVTITQARP
jgi:hypothetical protein